MNPRRTGVSDLPLHHGSAPPWLFQRMKALAREVIGVIVSEYGTDELLRKLSDPFWFQAFGCALGFDWHSSGLTTTVCGAIKEAVRGLELEYGICVSGGKGATSRKTPGEIERHCELLSLEPDSLVYSSRMSAKVDSAALQDGYRIYHHTFVFNPAGRWTVIQQGMNTDNGMARRYHWLGEKVDDFVCEPHAAVCCDGRGDTLNMVALESSGARDVSTRVAGQRPEAVLSDIERMRSLSLPARHELLVSDINPGRLRSILLSTYERQPEDFATLLAMRGVGPKTVRALSLVSELVHGEPVSARDPARFSFAHGGKDGHPHPVDRPTYDATIDYLSEALRQARLDRSEKLEAFRRLSKWGGGD